MTIDLQLAKRITDVINSWDTTSELINVDEALEFNQINLHTIGDWEAYGFQNGENTSVIWVERGSIFKDEKEELTFYTHQTKNIPWIPSDSTEIADVINFHIEEIKNHLSESKNEFDREILKEILEITPEQALEVTPILKSRNGGDDVYAYQVCRSTIFIKIVEYEEEVNLYSKLVHMY